MDSPAPEISILHQLSHPPGRMAKLQIVANGNLPLHLSSQVYQLLRFFRVQRKRLLDVQMAACAYTLLAKFKMISRRRRNMNDIRPAFIQHCADIAKLTWDLESLRQLSR